MNVVLFGATGMVGGGVLRECLAAPDVRTILAVGRTRTEVTHPKFRERIHPNLWDYTGIEPQLMGFDACFFCLGVSYVGLGEAEYTRLTYDLPLAAATTLARLNAGMTFVYVSGVGTDRSERGRTMWARVKGRTENALLHLPFKGVYLFRPGIIQPLHGLRSKTPLYRAFYTVTAPILPVLRRLFPSVILTTEQVGRAMLTVASSGWPDPVLEPGHIRDAARYRASL
jgi:uncharacterized protein YbjT (DUF2867 family)